MGAVEAGEVGVHDAVENVAEILAVYAPACGPEDDEVWNVTYHCCGGGFVVGTGFGVEIEYEAGIVVGFNMRHQEEDLQHLKELIMLRLVQLFDGEKKQKDDQREENIVIGKESQVNNNLSEKKPLDEFDQLPLEEQVIILKNRIAQLEKEKEEAVLMVEPKSSNIFSNLFKRNN